MKDPEYMKIPYRLFPQDIINRYNLESKKHGDYIYVRIKREMYGLKQAAVLAYQQLCDHLKTHGYVPIQSSKCMFQHKTRRTKFCLCVNDFGIKYFSKDDINHLLGVLNEKYKGTQDWEGKHLCGYTFNWNYQKGYVDVSMPGYVKAALRKLKYIMKKFPEYSPFDFTPIHYGAKGTQQYMAKEDTSNFLTPKETQHIQSIVGSFLYYARALDDTILPALNTIGKQQAQPTHQTKKRCQRLMDFLNTYPDAYLRFHASDMVLHIDSDAAYLVLPKARSRVAGYFHLANKPKSKLTNAPILIECKGFRHVVCSSAEAETAAVFHNAQTAVPIRRILISLGHPQPATPLKTDNSTTEGFVKNNIDVPRAKTWDMRLNKLKEYQIEKIFDIYWDSAKNSMSDYYTKTQHTTLHHREERLKHIKDRSFGPAF